MVLTLTCDVAFCLSSRADARPRGICICLRKRFRSGVARIVIPSVAREPYSHHDLQRVHMTPLRKDLHLPSKATSLPSVARIVIPSVAREPYSHHEFRKASPIPATNYLTSHLIWIYGRTQTWAFPYLCHQPPITSMANVITIQLSRKDLSPRSRAYSNCSWKAEASGQNPSPTLPSPSCTRNSPPTTSPSPS